MYNPSETSECYIVLSNPQRQIWFIPQRHLLAYRLIDSDEFFLSKPDEVVPAKQSRVARGCDWPFGPTTYDRSPNIRISSRVTF